MSSTRGALSDLLVARAHWVYAGRRRGYRGGPFGLSTSLHSALLGRTVVVVERATAGSQASGRAAGLFKSVQADELRTRLARRSIDKAVSLGDWAGVPLPVARSGSFLIARTERHRRFVARQAEGRAVGCPPCPAPWQRAGPRTSTGA